MAHIICGADGNLTSSGTWCTVDSTALVTEGGSGATTLTTSSQNSANFAPGAITVNALAIRIANRTSGSPTNTMTVVLYDATSSSAVATIAVPVADIPVSVNGDQTRGNWMLLALGANYTLEAGKNYQVRISLNNTSTAVAVMTNGTASNWQHMLRTTTTTAPSAGDNLWIIGLWTGSATWTAYTVTQDQTTTGTVYGSNPGAGETAPDQKSGIGVFRATLTWPTAANSAIALAGNLVCGAYSTVSMGTSASPVQRGYQAVLQFNTATAYGVKICPFGVFSAVGQSHSTGSRIWTRLSSNGTSGSTASLTVEDATGWTSGSTVYVSSTRVATSTDAAQYTLNADAGTNSLTFSAALSANYAGSAGGYPFPAAMVITSGFSVRIQSDAATRYHHIHAVGRTDIAGYPSVYIDWVDLEKGLTEFETLNGNMTLKNSVINHGTANLITTRYVRWSGVVNGTCEMSNVGIVNGGSSAWCVYNDFNQTSNLSSCSFYDIVAIADGGATPFYFGIHNIGTLRRLIGMGGLSYISLAGTTNPSYWSPPADLLSGSVFMGVGNSVIIFGNYIWRDMTISNVKGVASTSSIAFGANGLTSNLTIKNCSLWGARYIFDMGFDCPLDNVVIQESTVGGFTSASQTPSAIWNVSANQVSILRMKLLGCTFSNSLTTPVTTTGLYANGFGDTTSSRVPMQISVIPAASGFNASSGAYTSASWFTKDSYFAIHNYNGVVGDHRVYLPYTLNGVASATEMPSIRANSTVYNTAAPSEELIPKTTASKFESSVKRFAVTSGSTASLSVYVRKNSAYNGAAPRVIIKQNYVAGYTSDTVAATHSAAADAWQQLTTTIAAVADDSVLEVVVDCDGTTGSVYVDDWSAA